MKRHGKTRGELTINPSNYSRNRRKLLPGEQCQTTHMILQPLELLRSFMILFTSDDFSSPPPPIKQMRAIFSDRSCSFCFPVLPRAQSKS